MRGAIAAILAWGAAACGSGAAGVDATSAPDALACAPSAASSVPIVFGTADGIDLDSASALEAGRVRVIFDSFDAAFETGRLWEGARELGDLGSVRAPRQLELGDEAFVAAPSRVRLGDGAYLYFVVGTSLGVAPELARARIEADGFGPREDLGPLAGADSLLAWPRFETLPDGRIAVAFHDGVGRPSLALSDDGRVFGAATVVDTAPRAMAKVTAFGDGTLAFTYQTGANPMISYVRVAPPPAAGAPPVWSAPFVVTEASSNVHDTSAVVRADGDLDLYYIYPPGPAFRVFRRALARDGRLGPEEAVTGEASGDTSKPRVVRLDGCRVLLTYAEITVRDGAGQPIQQRLGAVVIDGDAPQVP